MARHKHKLTTCPNCDHQLDPHYDFCPMCGQENHDIRVPIGHIGYEFIEGITHFDTKVWQSLKSFFTKPGQMTKEYLDGKRAMYVPAPRLYIFFSFIFFLILSNYSHKASKRINDRNFIPIQVDEHIYKVDKNKLELMLILSKRQIDSFLIESGNSMCYSHESLRKVVLDSLKAIESRKENKSDLTIDLTTGDIEPEKDSLELMNERKKFVNDSIEKAKEILTFDSLYNRTKTVVDKTNNSSKLLETDFTTMELKLIRDFDAEELDSLIEIKRAEVIARKEEPEPIWVYKLVLKNLDVVEDLNFDNLFTKALKAFSMAMFIFMPIIAFITWIFFRKQRKYYVEHLIYAIHIHTFIFIFLSIVLTVILFYPWVFKKFVFWIVGIITVYILLSLRTVFANSWVKTIFKFIGINFIYMLTLLCAVLAAFVMGGLG